MRTPFATIQSCPMDTDVPSPTTIETSWSNVTFSPISTLLFEPSINMVLVL